MALFYVIYLHDGIAVDCIEAIRLLSNPRETKAAHLTVRGPFPNKIRLEDANKKLSGNRILLDGVGRFDSPNQNTVFFTCMGTKIRKVWNKPEYPFNPHVTIYDGESPKFSAELYDILSRHAYLLGFHADRLTALLSKQNTKSLYRPLSFNFDEVSEIAGHPINRSAILDMSEHMRLTLIDRLASFLAHTSLKTNPNFLFEQNIKRKTQKTLLQSLRQGIFF